MLHKTHGAKHFLMLPAVHGRWQWTGQWSCHAPLATAGRGGSLSPILMAASGAPANTPVGVPLLLTLVVGVRDGELLGVPVGRKRHLFMGGRQLSGINTLEL